MRKLKLPKKIVERVNWLRTAGYIAIILTIILVSLWSIFGINHDEKTVKPTPQKKVIKNPLILKNSPDCISRADYIELITPATLPWSIAKLGRLPIVEVLSVTRLVPESSDTFIIKSIDANEADDTSIDSETDDSVPAPPIQSDAEIDQLIVTAVEQRVPGLFEPFTLATSPPYLLTPVIADFHFYLGEKGTVKECIVMGESFPPELQMQIGDKALHLRFPDALSFADFTVSIKITPHTYNRLTVERGGKSVSDEMYSLCFRTLQYSSYYLIMAMQEGEGELLKSDQDRTIQFKIDNSGRPSKIEASPIITDPAEANYVETSLYLMLFPRDLVGCKVTIMVGG